MVGSFVFKSKTGHIFNASPKYNWDECKELWKQRQELIGKSATVKYFNLTPNDCRITQQNVYPITSLWV
jgi:hypothetical protein